MLRRLQIRRKDDPASREWDSTTKGEHMKTVGVLKIIIGIVAGIMFFGSSFGLTHQLEWLPELMENVGTVGLVVSAWIFLDGIKDIAEAISLDTLITAADRSDEERSQSNEQLQSSLDNAMQQARAAYDTEPKAIN